MVGTLKGSTDKRQPGRCFGSGQGDSCVVRDLHLAAVEKSNQRGIESQFGSLVESDVLGDRYLCGGDKRRIQSGVHKPWGKAVMSCYCCPRAWVFPPKQLRLEN